MRNYRHIPVIALFCVMPNLTAQIDMEEMQRRTAIDLHCGQIAADGAVRMRQKRWFAEDDFNREIVACKRDESCRQRAQAARLSGIACFKWKRRRSPETSNDAPSPWGGPPNPLNPGSRQPAAPQRNPDR